MSHDKYTRRHEGDQMMMPPTLRFLGLTTPRLARILDVKVETLQSQMDRYISRTSCRKIAELLESYEDHHYRGPQSNQLRKLLWEYWANR